MESEEDDECWDPKVRQAVSPISRVGEERRHSKVGLGSHEADQK